MPQKELVFSPSLLAIIADSAERIVFIQEEMGRFLSRPVTDYHGRNLYETVEEMTEEPLVVLPDGLGAGVLLHDQGKTYGLTLQKLMTGGIVTGIAGLIQENEAVEKQLEYELGLSVQRYKSALLQSSNVIWEYYMDEDRARFQNTATSPFGEMEYLENFSRHISEDGIIMEQYIPAFQQMLLELKSGKTAASTLLEAKKPDGTTGWYRITHTVLRDGRGGGNIAIGVAEDVSKEQLARARYEQGELYRKALVSDSLASYEIEIDNDRIKEKIIEKERDMLSVVGLSVNCSYREFLKRWADKMVHPQDRWKFLQELNPDFLRRQYENGQQEVSCEYRTYNGDGIMIWCETVIYLIMSGGHLNGFVYVKDIEKKKEKELELLRQSQTDTLTGLLNRAACLQRINKILSESPGDKGALMMIDIDNFKSVNDTFGHVYGDKVLAQVAYRMKNILGKDAVLGRFGGDEFIVFLSQAEDEALVCEKARLIAKELQNGKREGGRQVRISNSIGIAFCPRDGVQFQELYARADAALQHAKESGKSCYVVFGEGISEVVPTDFVNREWLIDELEEVVYISDIQDYSLLYINRAGREMTGAGLEDLEKKKCYQVLQNRDAPCPFCTNKKLKKEEFYTWEFENSYLKRNFIVKDKLVDWNGKPVRMEIAVDVGNRRFRDENLTSKYHLETVMLESLKILSSEDNLETAISRTLKLIGEFYGGERSYIIEIDRESGFARNTYEWCRKGVPSQKDTLQKVPLEAIPYIFETFDRKQHLIISRVDELKNSYPSEYSFLTKRRAHSLFAVPFEDQETYSGYIGVDNPNINQDTIRLLDSIAYNIANEIKKRRLYKKMEYEASHDMLSGLLNRSRYVQFQNEAGRYRDCVCGIVAADINSLKQVNHNYGHEKGDAVIKTSADIMRKRFPESHVFRLSGDEFVIITLGEEYEPFIRKVRSLKTELDLQTPNGVSIGCTWEAHLSDLEKLVRHAEELMLVNKHIYYKDSTDKRKHFSPETMRELTEKVEQGFFKLYLQPKFSPISGEVLSAEALVRYQEPGQGATSPGKFVPMLEQEKLIRYLDFFMMEQVCKTLARWKAEGKELIQISVNFSRITLLESDLLPVLNEIQGRYDIPRNKVMIEITESIGNIERKIIATIGSKLRKAGYKLSLDDFGSDYANMSILSIIHFDEVKLDKSLIDNLVENETNQTVVKGIIDMCRNLNVECVAEGVESFEQLELLKSYGCTAIQGFYYCKPMEVDEFEKRKLNQEA